MNNDIIDLPEFLERVQDDKELLLELLDIFEVDYEAKRKLLTQAIASKDYEQIRSIAHSLKGASGNISAKALRPIFLILEENGRSQDLSQAAQLLKDMDQQYALFLERAGQIKLELK